MAYSLWTLALASHAFRKKLRTRWGYNRLVSPEGYGASGEHENPIYFTRLWISIQNELGNTTTMQWEQEVQGIPGLEKPLKAIDTIFLGKKEELVGLIGRDILRHTLFTYNGSTGKVHFDFHLNPLKKIAAPPPCPPPVNSERRQQN